MANQNTTSISPKVSDLISTGVKPSAVSSPIISTGVKPSAVSSPIISTSLSQRPSTTLSTAPSNAEPKPSILKYVLLFILLIFLILTLVLYIIKPDSTKITDIYSPIITFFSKKSDTKQSDIKLANVINDKKIQSSDNSEHSNTQPVETDCSNDTAKDNEEVIQIIPVSNDTDDPIQSNSKTKSGSCYIGTDKGFRNCVSIGEGETCMSGDIFPTLEMCINPKLRE